MDPLVQQWLATLTEKEANLHKLAAVKLKKELNPPNDNDNGSYFADRCHAFVKWKKTQLNHSNNM
jgi:hypothetical protein